VEELDGRRPVVPAEGSPKRARFPRGSGAS
jgi:hypothetical protein